MNDLRIHSVPMLVCLAIVLARPAAGQVYSRQAVHELVGTCFAPAIGSFAASAWQPIRIAQVTFESQVSFAIV